VVELVTGKPPYFDLPFAAALYRIYSDDHPPLPEGISPTLKEFLMECFQKDVRFRSTALKLREHPWLKRARVLREVTLTHSCSLTFILSTHTHAHAHAHAHTLNTLNTHSLLILFIHKFLPCFISICFYQVNRLKLKLCVCVFEYCRKALLLSLQYQMPKPKFKLIRERSNKQRVK
jgi:serine/threonine protein kinase